VADRGDDRHRAGCDRAQEPLVAEREQVLEASTAAGEDDDVDLCASAIVRRTSAIAVAARGPWT
jgi:hypothetical protein